MLLLRVSETSLTKWRIVGSIYIKFGFYYY